MAVKCDCGVWHMDWAEQVAGRKEWKLYDALIELPRPDLVFKPTAQQIGQPFIDFILEAGDLLYVPAGLIHEAHCEQQNQPSLHLTLGIESAILGSWESLIIEAITFITQGAQDGGVILTDLRCHEEKEGMMRPLEERLRTGLPSEPRLTYGDLLVMTVREASSKEVLLRHGVPLTPAVISFQPVSPLVTLQTTIADSLSRAANISSTILNMATMTPGALTNRRFGSAHTKAIFTRVEEVFLLCPSAGGYRLRKEGEDELVSLLRHLVCVMRQEDSARWMMETFSKAVKEDILTARQAHIHNLERSGYRLSNPDSESSISGITRDEACPA